MKLVVLGASGGCGRHAVRLAAGRGHAVTAVVRPQTRWHAPRGVRLARADVLDAGALAPLFAGQGAVVSCLGPRRAMAWNPWSRLAGPPGFATRSAEAIVIAMRAAGVTRVAAISAAGVGDSAPALPGLLGWLLPRTSIGLVYADLETMEAVYRASGLEWIAVRPVTLVNAAPSGRARVVSRYRLASVIGRADVAAWLLDAATASAPPADPTPMIGWS